MAKTGKLSVTEKNGIFISINKLTRAESVNDRELELVARNMVEGLIPVTKIVQKKSCVLEAQIEDVFSLKNYCQSIFNKKMFLDVVLQTIKVVQACEKKMLNVRNLNLNKDQVFVAPRTKELFFIYWPVVNAEVQSDIEVFLRDLAFQLVFDRHEDHEYITSYIQFFKTGDPFSMEQFGKFIMKMAGITSSTYETHIPTGKTTGRNVTTGSMSTRLNSEPSTGNTGSTNNVAYVPPVGVPKTEANIAGSNEQKVMAALEILQNLKQAQPPQESEPEYGGGTTVLGDSTNEPAPPPKPVGILIRQSNQERIVINQENFTIGKKPGVCHYVISDNNAVSGKHASILQSNDQFYIFDNHSTNKTYLNGEVIPTEQAIEIVSEAKLKFGNEEFVFYIE